LTGKIQPNCIRVIGMNRIHRIAESEVVRAATADLILTFNLNFILFTLILFTINRDFNKDCVDHNGIDA